MAVYGLPVCRRMPGMGVTMKNDVIEVALKAGEAMLVHAQGSPAQVVAVGVAAAAVVVATAIGYGTYNMGEKLVDWWSDG